MDIKRALDGGELVLTVHLENEAQLDQFLAEQAKLMAHYADLRELFDAREAALIKNCADYATSANPAGLPGHNLMVIIAKLVELAGLNPDEFLFAWKTRPEISAPIPDEEDGVGIAFSFALEDDCDDCGGCSCDDCTP